MSDPSTRDAERAPAGPEADAALLDAAWSGLSRDLDRERGELGALRRAPLGGRVLFAAGVAIGMPLVLGVGMPRSDLGSVSPTAALLLGALTLISGTVGVGLAVRPLQTAPLAPSRVIALASSTCAAMLALAWAPLGEIQPGDGAHGTLSCGGIALGVAAAVLLLARLVGRGAAGAGVGAAMSGAASALAAVTAICPNDALAHLLVGHAAPLIAVVLVALALYVVPRRALA